MSNNILENTAFWFSCAPELKNPSEIKILEGEYCQCLSSNENSIDTT